VLTRDGKAEGLPPGPLTPTSLEEKGNKDRTTKSGEEDGRRRRSEIMLAHLRKWRVENGRPTNGGASSSQNKLCSNMSGK